MDSEPVAWPGAPRRRPRALPAEALEPGAEFASAQDEDGPAVEEAEAGEAAFSREPASPRRDAFAKRLNEELSRPPEPKATPPAPAAVAGAPQDAAPRSRATPTLKRPADGERGGDAERRAESERRITPPPPEPDAEPQDALDWELDNAIGAIIASGRSGEAETAPAPLPPASAPAIREAKAPEPVRPPSRPEPAEAAAPPAPVPAAERPQGSDLAPRRETVPVAPIGAIRRKPVPTFRFDRREEPDDPAPAVPPDIDDPLSNVFFDDVRQAFDAVHPETAGDSQPDTFSELDADSYDPPLDDDDELPPSLVRAAAPVRQRRRQWRTSGVAAAVVGIAGIAVVAVIGMNVFAGSGSSDGEPPIIRADARDVKVEPAADAGESEARPDIAERTALGESDRLVLPDSVTIADASAPDDDEALEEELVSRRVRTVVVRPDGTIVPAEPAEEVVVAAAESDATDAGVPDTDAAPPADTADDEAAVPGEEDGVPIEFASLPADDAEAAAASATAPEGADAFPQGESLAEETVPAVDPGATTTVVPRPRPPVPPTARRAQGGTASGAPAPARSSTPPESQPLSLQATAPREAAPVTPWDAPESAQTSAGASAPWAVQLASQRSRADAEASLRNLRQRYPSLVGGAEPMIVAANVDNRGTFYRVRLPAASRGEAAALCDRLKAAGADCFIGRN